MTTNQKIAAGAVLLFLLSRKEEDRLLSELNGEGAQAVMNDPFDSNGDGKADQLFTVNGQNYTALQLYEIGYLQINPNAFPLLSCQGFFNLANQPNMGEWVTVEVWGELKITEFTKRKETEAVAAGNIPGFSLGGVARGIFNFFSPVDIPKNYSPIELELIQRAKDNLEGTNCAPPGIVRIF